MSEEKIEKLENLMAQSQLMYQGLVVEMREFKNQTQTNLERNNKILTNLEANQIVMGKAMDSIKEDVHGIKVEVSRLVNVMSNFMDMVGMKFKEHEGRIEKLEGK